MPDNLYRRGGVYWARAKVRGSDHRRSLRTTVLKEAKVRLATFLESLEHFRFHGEARHTWRDAVVGWNAAATDVAPSTLTRYLSSIAMVQPAHLDGLFLDQINFKKIADVVAARKDAGATNATIRRDLTAVSSVLAYSISRGWLETNAALDWVRANRKAIKERREPIRLPDAAHIDAVVAEAARTRENGTFDCLIRFAQHTGMRQEEVAGLDRSQVKPHGIELHKTKRNRFRVVPLDGLNESAGGTLGGTPRKLRSSVVFWHDEGVRYANVSKMFGRVVARLVAAETLPFAFRFHDLRHWYAVDYLRRGGSIYTLQQILGHKSIKSTEVYLDYLSPAETERAKGSRIGAHVQGSGAQSVGEETV